MKTTAAYRVARSGRANRQRGQASSPQALFVWVMAFAAAAGCSDDDRRRFTNSNTNGYPLGSGVVTQRTNDTLRITPESGTIAPGRSLRLTAALYANGTPRTIPIGSEVRWSLLTPGVASITRSDILSAELSVPSTVDTGTVSVQARYQAVQATATYTISSSAQLGTTATTTLPEGAPSTVAVSPNSFSMTPMQPFSFRATATWPATATRAAVTNDVTAMASWRSNTPAVVRIGDGGSATGVAAGSATVVATFRTVSGQATGAVVRKGAVPGAIGSTPPSPSDSTAADGKPSDQKAQDKGNSVEVVPTERPQVIKALETGARAPHPDDWDNPAEEPFANATCPHAFADAAALVEGVSESNRLDFLRAPVTLCARDIMTGDGPDKANFGPRKVVTRYEGAVMLVKAFGPVRVPDATKQPARDVPATLEDVDSVAYAIDSNWIPLIPGTDQFEPGRPLTRGELAVAVARAAGLAPGDSSQLPALFPRDVHTIDDAQAPWVAAVAAAGGFRSHHARALDEQNGVKPGLTAFAPDFSVSRMFFAAVVYEVLRSRAL